MTDASAPAPVRPRRRGLPLPQRFLVFVAGLPIGMALLTLVVPRWGQVVLGGFDLAALAFIVSLWPLSHEHTAAQMREKARANDTGRIGMLMITIVMVIVILTAVTVELPEARHETGLKHTLALALVLLSLVIAWLFGNLIAALHYTHMYYRSAGEGGLNFPDASKGSPAARDDDPDEGPDYLDFAYFSLTLGMAFATSDITLPGRAFRRIVIIHAIAAFFYNLVVLAFTINVTASS